ncbi:MAG: helix-turn-helix domain-containing protein [Bacteroidota bacterium]
MSSRKENIIITALELFANEGYNATSTSKIAKQAEVSEGLIFRHFKNKQGLLNAVIAAADKRLKEVTAPLFELKEPKEIIRFIIEMPFNIDEDKHDFWRMQFTIKWEQNYYKHDKMKPILELLIVAFSQLGYPSPDKEAQLLLNIIEGISTDILRGTLVDSEAFRSFMLNKYEL